MSASLQHEIEKLGPWFHDLELRGVRTAPNHALGPFLDNVWNAVQDAFPTDMTGKTVLDIGCNAGFYSFKLLERGAQVTGVDHSERYLAQARFAAEVRGMDLELLRMDVYELDRLGRTFDYVLFMGVLYHLRHPLYGLEKVAACVGERLVFQTMVRGSPRVMEPEEDYPIQDGSPFDEPGFPAMYFVEHRYAGDPTNWWIPNDSGAAAMLRSTGLTIQRHVAPGIYLCARSARPGGP